MKRNLIPAYIISLAIIQFAFPTCKKDSLKCEKWEVMDDTHSRCVTGFCLYGSGTKQVIFDEMLRTMKGLIIQ